MASSSSSQTAKDRANARFEKARKSEAAGNEAMAFYAAQSKATRDKTQKLKELRLAKEAQERAAAAAAPKPEKPAKATAKTRKAASG